MSYIGQVSARAMQSADIGDDAVITSKIADDDVTQAKVANDAIGPDELASNAVVSASIVDGAILNADINASAALDATKIADGTVTSTEFQYINSLSSNAQTQLTARLPLAGGTMTGDLNLGDNVDINFGDGNDLKIYHNGSNSFISDQMPGGIYVLTNDFRVRNPANDEDILRASQDGDVELYYNDALKFTTTGFGVTIGGATAMGVTSDPSTLADHAHIYAKDDSASAEVYVRDEAGNVTKLSPHNKQGEWEYFSRNTITGKTVRVNMEEMIKDIEKLTGKKYIKEE